MASQESSWKPTEKKSKPVEKKPKKAKAVSPNKKITIKSSFAPIKAKKSSHKEGNKSKEKSKDSETKDSESKKEDNDKTKKKHEKLVKKAKRLKSGEETTASDSKSKDKEDKTKLKSKKKETSKKSTTTKKDKESSAKDKEKKQSITDKDKKDSSEDKSEKSKDKEKSSATKKRLLRSKLKLKGKRKSKDDDSKKDLREETKEEKGHNKDLLDTVFHKMELEIDAEDHTVKKEPEPVTEVKYTSIEDISKRVVGQVNALIDSLHEIFQLYKPDQVMLSFNGGKDCTVVLHLLNKFYQMNTCLKHIKLPTLYITDPDAFEEVDEFVVDCEKLFNIELIRKPGPIKKALEEICKEKPHIKAVFMGCRRTDPYCKDLKTMQPTDVGWPPLMRINPIIDWKCRDVWQYMYMYNVPYCSLYQKGYTSIGNKKDTLPNPYLRVIDKATGSIVDYRPGHELIDNDELERAGRIKVEKKENVDKDNIPKKVEINPIYACENKK